MISSSHSKLLLEAKGLRLDYPIRFYQGEGLRDIFISALKHPWEFLVKPNELLPVLKGINLKIYQGDRLGLLGTNGAGKTSLCRALCGMITPQAGEVVGKCDIEAIFEVGTGIMPELTGRENAQLLARIFYHTRHLPQQAIDEALDFSELGHFLDMPFKTYSKGMQSRLILSLISSSPCQLLILDEVFDGADIFFREKISARMKKKIQNSEAVIFVSHGPEQVRELCNRVVVLQEGNIVFDGSPEEGINYYLSNPSKSFQSR